jgi:signal transduction histidine kinase/CheY-like chemotaxis protein/HAMP domain-containing protein
MRNLKVSAQLIIGFSVILIFMVLLGGVANYQANKIHQQTEIIYQHPLQVRAAIGRLQTDILKMRLCTRDLMLSTGKQEDDEIMVRMKLAEVDAEGAFRVLKDQFLGSQAQVDSAYEDFNAWRTLRDENNKLAAAGNVVAVKNNVSNDGKVGSYREKLMAHLSIIDNFAKRKAVALYAESNILSDRLNAELIILVVIVIILSNLILMFLLQNIRRPIKELTEVANRFREGDTSARSNLQQTNEFGVLSNSFNSMVEKIEENVDLAHKIDILSSSMLVEDNSHRFFRELLPVLSEQTNSQMAAVYLLTEDKERFVHYESIGMTDEANSHVFSAKLLPGEFGAVLMSQKINRVKRIPIDTRFSFQTVSGNVIPREIITIPIVSGKDVIAIISLASIRKYTDQANLLIDEIFDILTARVEGILAYRKMRKFAKQLEAQNAELDAQKREMTAQATELIEQNRELEIQKTQLGEANKLKTNFLSNMSHELRTPLNSVIALSGVLTRRVKDKIGADEYSYLEVIERNGKHLLSLINDILDISRIEAGREEVEVLQFNAQELVVDLVRMIQPQAEQKKIELVQKSTNEVYISSDMNKCRHIIQNLISNAVKFTENGKVEVDVFEKNETVMVRITDTGIGILPEHISHIFDEFRQADASTSRRYGGTGLGLAIAKKYANLLGGTITVQSEELKGSVFTLVLPTKYSSENRIAEEIQPDKAPLKTVVKPLPKQGNERIILLVDDSEPAIIQMKDFLQESNYTILEASDGAAALEIVSQNTPDAMILDLMMPGVDGFSVLETLRNEDRTAHIPVLILTAKHLTKDDLKNLKRNNVHQLIQKGDVDKTELLAAVNHLFDKKEIEILLPNTGQRPIEGKPTVLIVEDNSDNMTTVLAIIDKKFNVLEALDGSEGIHMAKQHKPDLILMDIALPGIDGIQAFKAIRQNGETADIPIIALTASAMTSDREIILAFGFDAYIAKPINDKEFFSTIDHVLYGK